MVLVDTKNLDLTELKATKSANFGFASNYGQHKKEMFQNLEYPIVLNPLLIQMIDPILNAEVTLSVMKSVFESKHVTEEELSNTVYPYNSVIVKLRGNFNAFNNIIAQDEKAIATDPTAQTKLTDLDVFYINLLETKLRTLEGLASYFELSELAESIENVEPTSTGTEPSTESNTGFNI